MRVKYYLAGSLMVPVFFILLSSCQKNKNDDCTVSVASLSSSYKLAALKYKASAAGPEQDYLVFLDACEKDDILRLNSNGTWSSQDVGTVCTPNGNDTGTWSLNGNTINSDGLIDGTIQSFDCSTLIYYVADLYTTGDRLTFTLVKQ
jgi:Lipocalin-like domain